jgi:hypothetical protein
VITNTSDISLALAVWLLHDEYDYQNMPNYISATSLMKPLRHIVLGPRVDRVSQPADVADFIPSVLGSSLHDSIEKAWIKGYAKSLKMLGYPDSLIEQVRINPPDSVARDNPDITPIYLEQRMFREFKGFNIGGKFDMVTDGIIQDTKSTSAFTWVYGGRDDAYQLQMSIYRWLDAAQPLPKITADYGQINFIFTDWQKFSAKTNPKYPQKRVESKQIPLMSLADTEAWIFSKLSQIQKYKNTPEPLVPECSEEDLWRSDPVFKYFSDPSKTSGRSTKNFDTLNEAHAFKAEKGKGVVITAPSIPKRCGYCDAFSICSQKDQWFS